MKILSSQHSYKHSDTLVEVLGSKQPLTWSDLCGLRAQTVAQRRQETDQLCESPG